MNEHVSTPINGNAAWLVQLSLPIAFAADTSHMRPIRISQNLDPVISVLSHNDVAVPVEGNAVRLVELAGAGAFRSADSPDTSTVGAPQNLQAMIQLISDNKISIIVYGDEPAEKSVSLQEQQGGSSLHRILQLAKPTADFPESALYLDANGKHRCGSNGDRWNSSHFSSIGCTCDGLRLQPAADTVKGRKRCILDPELCLELRNLSLQFHQLAGLVAALPSDSCACVGGGGVVRQNRYLSYFCLGIIDFDYPWPQSLATH